jgi:DNA-binding PadR family transcriptional regulator
VAKRRKVGNLLGLALLALLVPGRPMHPYEMATFLRETGKERDIDIKWGSLYTVVQNLAKHGFIVAAGSGREGRRPERTLYTLTDSGRAELTDWMHELLGVPENERPRFQTALSVLGVLPPDTVIELLTKRLRGLRRDIDEMRSIRAESAGIPRIFLIEMEYAQAMREAEVAWVEGLLEELKQGSFPDIETWRRLHLTGTSDPLWEQMFDEKGRPKD